MNTREPQASNVEVSYRDAEPRTINVSGGYADGEYWRSADYTFRIEGSTAVLKTIEADNAYSVQLAAGARDAVRETVAALPFVQAVTMFPEVDE